MKKTFAVEEKGGKKMQLIDMNTMWKCETCFHHGPNGCNTFCDAGEGYRPAASKFQIIDPDILRPKWIPVDERLPAPHIDVLTLRETLDGRVCYQKVDHIVLDYGAELEWLTDLSSWKSKVTHWMPLPMPPKEET